MWTLLLTGCLIDDDLYRDRMRELEAAGGETGLGDADTAETSDDSGFADADGDGVPAGDDCDDADPDRYPGNDEVCDGADQDCDADVDEDAVDAITLYRDADGDGWGLQDEVRQSCSPEDGWSSTVGDCDDLDVAVNPDAGEALDGVDGDCSGAVDDLVATRDLVVWSGTEAYGRAGEALLLHDLDGDGTSELYVGAPGREGATDPAGVWRVSDPAAGGTLSDLAWSGAEGSRFGAALAGWEGGIAIGAPEEEGGGVYVGGDGPTTLWNLSYGVAEAGSALSVGDTDGDGIRELLVGAPSWTRTTQGGGAVFVSDVTDGDMDLDVGAEWRCYGVQERERVGGAVLLWDVDGDGHDDVVTGAAEYDDTGVDNGVVYVLPTWVSDCDTSDAWIVIPGASDGDFLGRSVVGGGDADGDGLDELSVGAPGVDGVGQDGGAVYLFESLRSGTMATSARDLQLDAAGPSQLVGSASFAVPSGALLVGSSRGEAAWLIDDLSAGFASVADFASVDGDASSELGTALSASDSVAWIGAPGTSSEVGAVYVAARP